jgi:hypothetical protein
MKFDMNIVPLKATHKLHFLISYSQVNNNAVDTDLWGGSITSSSMKMQ